MMRSDGTVDKKLMANLLVSLLSCPVQDRQRRLEILQVVGQALGLEEGQRRAIGLGEQPGLVDEYTQPRLAELWTAFLLGQSTEI